ncbi:hypothetical protein [Janthinobacterium sp. LB2P10]|uniref:hypothetical protein n=1 Tax=Janthinobacterium sp. LB2P10 TaxID=3424194 RepID=UPI003F22B6D0
MKSLLRAAGTLALTVLMALAGCSKERHRLDRHLAQLHPDTVTALPEMGWPAGTLLCPLTTYQSDLDGSEPPADKVNAFLAQKQFLGNEGYWSLILVKPAPAGDNSIEQLIFKRAEFDVINDATTLKRDAETVPAGFAPQTCIPVERARVLLTRTRGSHRKLVIFGTA